MTGLMRWIWVSLLLLGVGMGATAHAQDDEDDEIVVYGDRFKRWDKTRWSILTEVMLTAPIKLRRTENDSMRITAYQLRMVMACEKDWKISRGKWEVLCEIEDVGFQAVGWRDDATRTEINAAVIAEVHQRLAGAALQLQVTKNGRVSNVQIEGKEARNRREMGIQETARQLVLRMMAGFDMKLRKHNFLKTGQWVEYRTPLFDMPNLVERENGGMSSRSNMGSALVVHQLDPYKGHLVVQSVGKGTVVMAGNDGMDDMSQSYSMNMEGVSIYQKEGGFMTDRVWYVTGAPTGNFWASSKYFSAGRLEMLGEKQQIDVGPTQQVNLPKHLRAKDYKPVEGLPTWVTIEENGEWQRPQAPNLPAKK